MTFSTIDVHRSAKSDGVPLILSVFFRFLRRLSERRAEARAYAATRAILAGLDDATLKDIGLHRSEISSIAGNATPDRRRLSKA